MTHNEEDIPLDEQGDDDSDIDDEHEKMSHIRNLRNDNHVNTSSSSLRRYDEFASFMTRSERNLHNPDQPPSEEEKRKRKVQFKEDDLEKIYPIEPLTESERENYYMQPEDFISCDRDTDITAFRWENHVNGKIPFDEDNNTLRGLEDLFDGADERLKKRTEHARSVLQEMNRQRLAGQKALDWNKIHQISEQHSKHASERALQLAKDDETASKQAWDPHRPKLPFKRDSPKKNKKKSANPLKFLAFWNKK